MSFLPLKLTSRRHLVLISSGLPCYPQFISEGVSRRLVLRSASVHEEGEYTCSLDDQECTCEVTVVELPPVLTKKMTDTTVTRGERAIFEVALTKVRWRHRDVVMP